MPAQVNGRVLLCLLSSEALGQLGIVKRIHVSNLLWQVESKIRAGDDARDVKVLRPDELRGLRYAFDHESIIGECLRWREGHPERGSGHRTEPWVRTACI